MKKILFLLLIISFFSLNAFAKRTTITFWHANAGHLGSEIKRLALAFNQKQSEFKIKPVYKGDYIETLTSFAAAFRAHHPPDIIQVFEVGTATMLAPKGVIKPVHKLFDEQHINLPLDDFFPSVRDYYSRNDKLMALPLNISAPIIYYNAEIIKKAGYDERNFPKTWQDLSSLVKKLKNLGYQCGYTTAYPGWVLVESYMAIHGLSSTKTKPLKAQYNYPAFNAHLKRLKQWHSKGYLKYGGRTDESTSLFISAICPMYSQSSGAYNSLNQMVDFKLGIAPMPLDKNASKLRYPNVAGGAALWVVSGRSPHKEKGIASFFKFLIAPKTQKHWHEHTGYLPIGLTGLYASILEESKHPTLLLARNDLQGTQGRKSTNTENVPQHQIRMANDESIEAMFAGLLTPNEAIDESISKADHLIKRYIRNTQSIG